MGALRILFVGESWQGSNARSLREAMSVAPGVSMTDIAEDACIPKRRSRLLRIVDRLLLPLQRRELEQLVLGSALESRPDVAIVYKGANVGTRVVERLRATGALVVNVFPDLSPASHGSLLGDALGRYDTVISTKSFHPAHWRSTYGYANECVHVAHGYDPQVHWWPAAAAQTRFDVVLCATCRPEYLALMQDFARELGDADVSVAIGGHGWSGHRERLPAHWTLVGAQIGRAYGELLRSGKIAIAPLSRIASVRDAGLPGDEDTTRTYELAAAHCFFLHQRTARLPRLYDEETEVPLWSDARELADLVRRWLPDAAGRARLAANAHRRAVPAYSIPARAEEILQIATERLQRMRDGGATAR